jgi:2-amino-4-hydroxy-6-hydroxymethyldihydropteridine diphosphokinase
MRSGGERAFVALGANLGDRAATFEAVIERFERTLDIRLLSASPIYETPPVGPPDQPAYLNAVVELRVWLDPQSLLTRLQRIETELGRDRSQQSERWGPRPIDLDLLLFGERRVELPELSVPHPRLHERAFVLVPLAALAPDLRHPVLGTAVDELMRAQPDLDALRVWPRPPGWPGGDPRPGPQ